MENRTPSSAQESASRNPARSIAIGAAWVVGAAAVAGLYGGTIRFALWEKSHAQPPPSPIVTHTRPAEGEKEVLPNAFVACDVYLPHTGHGVETASLEGHVGINELKPDGTKVKVPGHVNTSGGGDSIIFQPTDMLETGAHYEFWEDGVCDTSDSPQRTFQPFSMKFKTADAVALSSFPAAFDKFPIPTSLEQGPITFTSLAMGPDHRLYAGCYDGRIFRYDILPGGQLSHPTVIMTVREGNKNSPQSDSEGHRLITGLTFDPKSTPVNMVLWVTNGYMALEHCPDWTSKVSRLSGPNLSKYEDYVVGLPRAWRDHLTFEVAFLPDGTMLFNQGSNSSTGAADDKWGLRNEHLLNAATLQMDPVAIANRLAAGQGPLNVKTEGDGHYNPWAPDAPVKLYATGLRCGFGLLYHRNGHLYAALNGGAAGGQAPGTPDDLNAVPRRLDQDRRGPYDGPAVPALSVVNETQPDLFIDIVRGGYYGHPNATRGEFVLNGGNPDGGKDDYQVHDYPVGTKPDRNWHRPAWNEGLSPSCDGLIEYKGNFFGGALDGKILTCRYSGGKDIYVLDPAPDGSIRQTISGIEGFTQFVDPLALVEDQATGDIYVAEFGGQRLTLLKPKNGGGRAESRRVFVEKPRTPRPAGVATAD